MDPSDQSYARHARYVPMFHFVLFLILLANLAWTAAALWRHPGWGAANAFALAVGLGILTWYARSFALTVQDRVIRLEEALRMQRLLPADLAPRVGELSRGQYVALRFASDAELPALVRRVLDERLTDPKAIKALVKTWRPDHLRA